MRIKFANGIAYFAEMGYVPYSTVDVPVDFGTLDRTNVTITAKVNDCPSTVVKDTVRITKTVLEAPTIKVDFRFTNTATGAVTDWPMDAVEIHRAARIGPDAYEQYPAAIKTILQKLTDFEKFTIDTAKALVEISKQGGIL